MGQAGCFPRIFSVFPFNRDLERLLDDNEELDIIKGEEGEGANATADTVIGFFVRGSGTRV